LEPRFVEANQLKAEPWPRTVVELPLAEVERRWALTTPQWPIMNAVLHGVDRNQLMARHKSNHIQVAYAEKCGQCERALLAKAVAFRNSELKLIFAGGTSATIQGYSHLEVPNRIFSG